MKRAILFSALVFALCVFTACNQTTQQNAGNTGTAPAATNESKEWDAYVEQFINDYFAANPHFAVYQGRHDFDGKLPDWSEEGLKKEIARLKSEREKAAAFKDGLSERQQFERDYLIAQIDSDLFWQETADLPHTNPTFYGNALDPDVYISRPYAPLEQRILAYTAYAKNVPAALEQAKKNLKTPMPKTYVKIGRQSIGGLAEFLEKDVAEIFKDVKNEQSQKDFKEANAAAAKAIKDFDAWMATLEKTATNDFALGKEKFAAMVKQTEGVDTPIEEIEKIGMADLEKNFAAYKAECEKFAPGKTLMECNKLANATKAEGKDVVEGARNQLAMLRKFLEEKQLVTIPGAEECKVDLAPKYKASNFAYINTSGPYEKNLPSVYYVAPPDPTWSKEKQAEYIPGRGALLFTSVHEAYPGHFLHFLHSNRAKSKFGQVFVGYAFAEGWAHYTEEMMYDAGLENNPEMHLGQLQEALLRNVRLVSAIGMHTKGMTVEESKKLFMEKGMQDEGNADQQAERGTYDPAYLNYTMGKLMIRKMRDDYTKGDRSKWKEFHDKFLSYGGPPIPMVRKAIFGKDDKGSLF